MTDNSAKDVLWLFLAGRPIRAIAKHVKISEKSVRRRLISAGLITPVIRPIHLSAMQNSIRVPHGDPLLRALRKHHPERMAPKEEEQHDQRQTT